MQVVLAVPPGQLLRTYPDAEGVLTRHIAGVPLLVRVIATAMRAGAESLLVLWPPDVDQSIWEQCARSTLLEGLDINFVVRAFEPRRAACWTEIEELLDDTYLWLPWNWVTHKRAIDGLKPLPFHPAVWDSPVLLRRQTGSIAFGIQLGGEKVAGLPITPQTDTAQVERFLIANSGKPTDGIHSQFNRWFCRPAVRLLSHTRVTPNGVTLAGLAIGAASAVSYARGFYAAYVFGALLFFVSGLFDEADGMLARVKFRESVFGTWFEGLVDEATYLLLFAGIAVGLNRQRGPGDLTYGYLLLIGCALSIAVTRWQRKLATEPGRPHEYSARLNRVLESDTSNVVSLVARQVQMFIKKGVVVHYLLIFTVFGGLPLLLRLAALGANLTWIVALYFNRRFFRRGRAGATVTDTPTASEML